MEIIARYATEVEGFGVVRKGQKIDLPEEFISQRIVDNFMTPEGARLKAAEKKGKDAPPQERSAEDKAKAAIDKTVSVMGRAGLAQKLDDMGITYKATHRAEYLAKLYLQATGEID